MAWASAGANAITKATSGFAGRSDVIRLYRDVQHQLARVLTIYDITEADCPLPVARESIRAAFEKNKEVQDPRVVSLLVARGQQELEETLMQWKQKSQLLRTLTPAETTDRTIAVRAIANSGGAAANKHDLFMSRFLANEDSPEDTY